MRYKSALPVFMAMLCMLLFVSYAALDIGQPGGSCLPLATEMSVPPTTDPFWGSINDNLISPGARYIAGKRRAGSRGCESTIIYNCRQRRPLYTLGCVNDIFPAESWHEVVPVEWLSADTLRLSYRTELQSNTWEQFDITLSGTPDFSPLGQHWRADQVR